MILHRGLFTVASLALSLSGISPAIACSMCKCGDPTFNALGTQVFVADKLRFTVDWARFEKTAAEQPESSPQSANAPRIGAQASDAVVNNGEEMRVTFGLAYSVKDRLTVMASLPFAKHQLTGAGEALDSRGLADPEFTGVVRVWRDVSAVVGVKTAWGRDELEAEGERLDQHLQPGTGSTDWTLGGSIVHQTGNVTAVYGSLMHRFTGSNRLGYEYGNSWLANIGVQRRFNRRFSGSLELNGRDAGQDRINDADEIDANSGGRVAYVSPRLLVHLGHDVVARAGLQVPVYERLDGVQDEKVNFHVGLTAVF
ncbi:MAG: hypothetical protein U0V87_07865 [Acidobacteriota bacterium]